MGRIGSTGVIGHQPHPRRRLLVSSARQPTGRQWSARRAEMSPVGTAFEDRDALTPTGWSPESVDPDRRSRRCRRARDGARAERRPGRKAAGAQKRDPGRRGRVARERRRSPGSLSECVATAAGGRGDVGHDCLLDPWRSSSGRPRPAGGCDSTDPPQAAAIFGVPTAGLLATTRPLRTRPRTSVARSGPAEQQGVDTAADRWRGQPRGVPRMRSVSRPLYRITKRLARQRLSSSSPWSCSKGEDAALPARSSRHRGLASAEDVVQEAWMRWQRTDRSQIKNPAAFLTTTTTNLAINVIQSARHRRETATDSPVLDRADAAHDPATSAQQTGAVERTLAHLMARLTRGELAAYLLRKGFDYPYCDIADLLGTSAANSRQLVRRAQPKLHGDFHRSLDRELHRELVAAFFRGSRTGDLRDLEQLLSRQARNGLHRPAPAPARAA